MRLKKKSLEIEVAFLMGRDRGEACPHAAGAASGVLG